MRQRPRLAVAWLVVKQTVFPTTRVSASSLLCDESKCKSPDTQIGGSANCCWVPLSTSMDNNNNTLLVNDKLDSMLCADDFVPQIVDDDNNSRQVEPWREGHYYYTCCPKSKDENIFLPMPQRECYNSACSSQQGGSISDDNQTNCLVGFGQELACKDNLFPRIVGHFSVDQHGDHQNTTTETTSRHPYDQIITQYTCCETELPNYQDCSFVQIGFFEEGPPVFGIEALAVCFDGEFPYDRQFTTFAYQGRNVSSYACCKTPSEDQGCSTSFCDSYSPPIFGREEKGDCFVETGYGFTRRDDLMTCSGSDVFPYPHVTYISNVEDFVSYTCCKSKEGSSGVFLRDATFWLNLIPQLVISFVVFCILLLFIVSVLASKSTRDQSFNLILVFLEIPDAIMNATLMGVACYALADAPFGNPYVWMNTIFVFTLSANMWLNAVLAHELLTILSCSKRRMRVRPPTQTKICVQAAVVFLYAACVATIKYTLLELVPLIEPIIVPIVIVAMLCAGIPLFYVSYVCFRIWKGGLLPRRGSTRNICAYFGRIVLIFYGMYLPGSILYSMAYVPGMQWAGNVGIIIISLQGAVSVYVAVKKPDLRKALHRVVHWRDETSSSGNPSGFVTLWGNIHCRMAASSVFSLSRDLTLAKDGTLRRQLSEEIKGDLVEPTSKEFTSSVFSLSRDGTLAKDATLRRQLSEEFKGDPEPSSTDFVPSFQDSFTGKHANFASEASGESIIFDSDVDSDSIITA